MDIQSLNRLIAHTPWSASETSERQTAAASEAKRSSRRSKLVADTCLFVAALLIGVSGLHLLKGGTGALIPAHLSVGALLLIVGLRVQVNRQTEDWALAQWRMDQGITALSHAELWNLKELSKARPEALQRIVAWESLGLVLRWRDRDAIEAYLRDNNVSVPDREELSIADHFEEAKGVGNG